MECELSSLELYESDWVCVKSGIFDKKEVNSVTTGKCNFGKKKKLDQNAPKLKFLCAWNQNEESLAITAREGKEKSDAHFYSRVHATL